MSEFGSVTLGHETYVFVPGSVAPGGRRSRVSISAGLGNGLGFDLGKLSTKGAQHSGELDLHLNMLKNCGVRSTFGRWSWQIANSLIHWWTKSSIHWWCIASLNYWFFASLAHRLMNSLFRWFIASLFHWVSHTWILSGHFSGISITICSFVDAPHNFNTSLLLHLKNFPLGHGFLLVGLHFSKFPSQHGPSTIWCNKNGKSQHVPTWSPQLNSFDNPEFIQCVNSSRSHPYTWATNCITGLHPSNFVL